MKKQLFFFLALAASVGTMLAEALATKDAKLSAYEGTDFYVTLMRSDERRYDELGVTICAKEAANVVLENPYTGYRYTVQVGASDMKHVVLDSANCYVTDVFEEQVCDRALHVFSDKPVSLFAANYKQKSFDASSILPTAALGSEYRIQCYSPSAHSDMSQGSQFAIVAAEDNVVVDIILTASTNKGEQPGDTLTTDTLKKGQVYYVWTGYGTGDAYDFTGTSVAARDNKKIAVFNGNSHTNIPTDVRDRDQLYAQAYPIKYWGTRFAVTSSLTTIDGIQGSFERINKVRVQALVDGTELRIDGVTVHTFDFEYGSNEDRKHFFEFDFGAKDSLIIYNGDRHHPYYEGASHYIETSCPCAVHLFSPSNRYDHDKTTINGNKAQYCDGDPFMIWVSPLDNASQKIPFINHPTPLTSSHYVNIVTHTANVNSVQMDGVDLSDLFKPIAGNPDYSYARIAGLSNDYHVLTSDSGCVAYVYGMGNKESYGYSVGGTVQNVVEYGVQVNYNHDQGKINITRGMPEDNCGIGSIATGVCILEAIPYARFDFVKWSDGVTDNPRYVVLTQDTTFTAIFEQTRYAISYRCDKSRGYVTGPKMAQSNDTIEFTAVPYYNYQFIQWSDGIKNNPRKAVITQDTVFTAEFAIAKSGQCGDDWALTWSYDSTANALTISGEGTLNSNYTFGLEAPEQMKKLVIAEGVTSIGSGAFSGKTTLQEITLPTTLKTVGDQAFYNCTGLTQIYNYRERPAVAYSTTFDGIDKFDCTLHVLSASIDMYKAATAWRDFYYIETIDAAGTTVDTQDVTVEPTDNTATVTWPVSNEAATYTIQIFRDGMLLCTLLFDANGQLTGIAFAPGRDGAHNTPAATLTANGLRFTITGLTSGTDYAYSLTAKDGQGAPVASYSGEFTTTGALQGIDNIRGNRIRSTKLIRDGQLYILRGDKTYTFTGAEVK